MSQKTRKSQSAESILESIGISSNDSKSKTNEQTNTTTNSVGRSIGSFTLNYKSPRGFEYSLDVARYGLHTKAVHIVDKSNEKIVKKINGKEAIGHMDFFYTIEGDDTHYTKDQVEHLVDGKPIAKMEASKSISNNGGNIPITKLDSILFSDKFYALMPKNKDKKTKQYTNADIKGYNEISLDLLDNDEAIYVKGLVLAKGYTNQTNAIIYPVINSNGEYGLRLKTFIAKVEDEPYYISDSSNVFEEQKQSENTLDMSSAIEVEL